MNHLPDRLPFQLSGHFLDVTGLLQFMTLPKLVIAWMCAFGPKVLAQTFALTW